MTISRRAALAAGAGLAVLGTGPRRTNAQTPASPAPDHGQAPGYYRYRIGDIEVTAINDGYADRSLEGYVKNVALAEVETEISKLHHGKGKIRVPYNSLVLRTGGKTVMIDAGNGDSGAPTTGRWMANFKAAGFDPKDVSTVLLTHLHGDHINGLRLKSGQGMFESAEIKLPEAEHAFWMDDARMNAAPPAMKGAFENVRRVLASVPADQLVRFEPGAEVAPGITSVAAFGHTPGHTLFTVKSEGQSFAYVADLTNVPSLFARSPDWSVTFDMDKEMARATRRKMFDMIVKEKMMAGGFHFPFPAFGTIDPAGNGYQFKPVA